MAHKYSLRELRGAHVIRGHAHFEQMKAAGFPAPTATLFPGEEVDLWLAARGYCVHRLHRSVRWPR
jgi:hypothetical protein